MKTHLPRRPLRFLSPIRLLAFIACLSSCSIYRSDGRKTFEVKVPQKLQGLTSYQLLDSPTEDFPQPDQGCEILNEFEVELRAQYSSTSPEILNSKDGLEIWKTPGPQGQVQITSIEALNPENRFRPDSVNISSTQKYSVCQYVYPSLESWDQVRGDFNLDPEASLSLIEF